MLKTIEEHKEKRRGIESSLNIKNGKTDDGTGF